MLLFRGFNEAVNGFTDDGWSMLESDGIDDVTLLVNSSPSKMMGVNLAYGNGFPSASNGVLCAKASMLLQVRLSGRPRKKFGFTSTKSTCFVASFFESLFTNFFACFL